MKIVRPDGRSCRKRRPPLTEQQSFSELGLSPKVLDAVTAAGYENPTPIQAGAIPYVLQRRDVLGIAQTGTGKTASFTLPMLTLLEKGRARARMPRTLILEPTRELAAQVEENFSRYGINHKLTVALLIGGVSFDEQDRKLSRGADVLIATPGRLLDHFERGKLLLQGVEILVIDEADRMLDMGFIPDIERISKLIPFTRQTLFFSATMPPEIQRLTEQFLHNPTRVEVSKPASTVATVSQRLIATGREPHDKRETLRELIRSSEDLQNAIVFCNRKRDVATVARSLQRHGFNAGALHGDMDQHARMAMLDDFRSGKIAIMVASDVAARGLDIPAVSHVFNYDIPTHAEDYVHRIGRTGRAGRKGAAIGLVTPSDSKYVKAIEDLIGFSVEWIGDAVKGKGDDDGGRKRGRRSSSRKKAESDTGGGGGGERSARSERPARPERPARSEKSDEPKDQPQVSDDKRTEPREQPKSRAKGSDQGKSGKSRRSGRNSGKHQDEPVIGLGDHVPAFLLRPVRLPKKTTK
ncbi:DEAD/DEAH box helicase [Rhodobium orientis]|uniref:DEAD-box ATP-dependent RNA helicase RhpA n=1 Tax=Rhodobium orientis TaxID=34017 RepID=A0A327JRJ6_9HYPH|nr:DEAD/DEAH box helicase [Rhodobium orientis]MBK5951514.1 DEAD/DEAH box helicase [Rhodobium orientis]RAI29110.1 DEAD/DEAH box helicase [Rhodobium orientis]